MTTLVAQSCLLLCAVLPHDPTRRVHDFANVLPAADRQHLESLAEDVERRTKAQFAIVTVRSLEGKSIEAYANALYKEWGIGHRDVNNGVLLLVAPREHKERIEVGYGLEPLLTDALCGEIRDDAMLPRFRNNDLPGGIRAGAEQIADILLQHPDAARGVPGSGPIWVRTAKRDALTGLGGAGLFAGVLAVIGGLAKRRRNYSTISFFIAVAAAAAVAATAAVLVWKSPKSPLVWGCAAAAAGAIVWTLVFNVRRYQRFGPNACRRCGTRLELLDEKADDAKLTEVQQLEERIGSVDYDVWYCPACLQTHTESYLAWFSGFTQCPSCKAQAFREGSEEVLRRPTTLSAGQARVVGTCMSCKKRRVRLVTLARLADSTSSSGWGGGSSFSGGGGGGGSSFGGGSSGGGGASGSW